MSSLPAPPPWRRFLEAHRTLATESPVYARLAEAFEARDTRVIPNEIVDSWDGDTRAATLEIRFVGGQSLQTKFQPVGFHDGQTFRWVHPDEFSPGEAAAIAARESLARLVPGLPVDGSMRVGRRDVVALMALCAQALNVPRAFCAPMRGGSLLTMFLEDPPAITAAPERTSWIGKLLKRPRANQTFSPFELLNDLIAQQVSAVQIAPQELARIERLALEVDASMRAGDHSQALQQLSDIREMLGRFYIDQEPTGWLMACEGVCRMALGQAHEAAAAFRDSLRSISPPDAAMLRMGLARTESSAVDRDSALAAVYLSAPDRFAQLATADEVASITARIDRLEAARDPGADAEAALRAALVELCEHERDAWRTSEEAASHRTESHVLCEQDQIADARSTALYRDLLLAWFTVPTVHSKGSMSSKPDQDPARLRSLACTPVDDTTTDITAVYSGDHGLDATFRYRLRRVAIALSTRTLWRIAGIWSVWPDEEIALI